MIPRTVSTFASLAAAALFIVACGGPPAPAASPGTPVAPAAAAGMKDPGDAKIGDKTKCAVSGEEMTVEASSPKAEYEGKTYYFCCSGCKKKFEADPAKYVKKS